MELVERSFSQSDVEALIRDGVHPALAHVYAARGVRSGEALRYSAKHLLPPTLLKGATHAAAFLADAIATKKKLLIVADYDADGATACAVGLRALRAFGAEVDYLVPDRFKLGYGLSPELAELAAERKPDVLITVDNGIASVEGVARANELGMATVVTDHHLPGDQLPAAECIVNPNQPGCEFPSKALAGVGVVFYVMLALRAELRRRGAFRDTAEPNLAELTDLVALGTVADVVPLDANNRNLVTQGIARLRAGRGQAGVRALLAAAGRRPEKLSTFDLGFAAGPRLNAAGRLADMSLGIETLITDDPARAADGAQQLDTLNRERRKIEADMLDEAVAALSEIPETGGASVALFEPSWHQGVIGILASRVKERVHRPVVCFARNEDGTLRGSGRSISGLHLRDCLDLVAKRNPGLIVRFGGHAQAAGLTIRESDLGRFTEAFEGAAAELTPQSALARVIETDGPLSAQDLTLELAQVLEQEIWGQGFPAPVFCDTFDVHGQRVVGERHLKLRLAKNGRAFGAIQFNVPEAEQGLPARIRAAYRLTANEFNGATMLELTIEHAQAA